MDARDDDALGAPDAAAGATETALGDQLPTLADLTRGRDHAYDSAYDDEYDDPDDHLADTPPGSLHVTGPNGSCRLGPDGVVVIGRGSDAGLIVNDRLVSRKHAIVHQVSGRWRVTDLDSANGLWRDGVRVSHTVLDGATVIVRLGGPEGAAVRLRTLDGAPAAGRSTRRAGLPASGDDPFPDRPANAARPAPVPAVRVSAETASAPGSVHGSPGPTIELGGSRRHVLPPGAVGIGRAARNGIVLPDLMVSREHAHLVRSGDDLEIVDLESANGTYVNGKPVTRCKLAPNDRISIGPYTLTFDGATLLEADQDEGVDLAARHVGVTLPDGRRLLDDLSFSLPSRTLTAVIGPSGAGKSTLLGALAGLRPPDEGEVLHGGHDLYAQHALLSRQIGFVPQEDILHRVLTLRQALDFGARLRFPTDTSAAEREARIEEVTAELQLAHRMDTRIDRLSGGERKRASTALELLTRPKVLFLDEPTSGLDVDLDRSVMRQLRALADGGRTVVVVTHNLEHLDGCDAVVILGQGGHLTYLGPPSGVFAHFGVSSWADVFDAMKSREPAEWARQLRDTPDRHPFTEPPPRDRRVTPVPDGVRRRPRTVVRQLTTLVRRQLAVTASDRTLMAILVLLPVALALLARGVPGDEGLSRIPNNRTTGELLLVIAVGGALMGMAGSVRDLVGERAVHRRERAVGLSWVAYLASKVVTSGTIAVLQGALLSVLTLLGRKPPAHGVVLSNAIAEMTVAGAAVTLASAMVGLLISAAVRDESQAMPVLVFATMLQLMLCGGVIPVAGTAVLEQLAWIVPARWAFAMTSVTVDNQFQRPDLGHDPAWDPNRDTWFVDLGLLFAVMVGTLLLCAVLLRTAHGLGTARSPRGAKGPRRIMGRRGGKGRRDAGGTHPAYGDDVDVPAEVDPGPASVGPYDPDPWPDASPYAQLDPGPHAGPDVSPYAEPDADLYPAPYAGTDPHAQPGEHDDMPDDEVPHDEVPDDDRQTASGRRAEHGRRADRGRRAAPKTPSILPTRINRPRRPR